MAELYDFTDRDGDGLRIVRGEAHGYLTVSKEAGPASVELPTGADAVALARAILAAAGDTGHEVARTDEIDAYRARSARGFELTCEVRQLRQQRADLRAQVRDVEAVAESMRERAVDEVVRHQHGLNDDPEEAIRALPLFPDEPARSPLTADTDT